MKRNKSLDRGNKMERKMERGEKIKIKKEEEEEQASYQQATYKIDV